MRKAMTLVATVLCAFALMGARPRPQSESGSNCCTMAREALKATKDIRIGMTRRQVESHFRLDGGAQVRDNTRYVYRDCAYIQVDINFKIAAPVNSPDASPGDVVTKVSEPYLAYPTID
jgi:hypothetical protein